MGKTEEILEILRRELQDGKYKPGSKFPSEHQLTARFDTSRVTVNKITMQLASEGFLERRKQGAGTYVKEVMPFPAGHLAYIGVISHPYFARIINGIQKSAFLKNYAVSVFSPTTELIIPCLEKICHSRFRGLLVSNIGIIRQPLPIPVVYVDNGYELGPSVRASVSCTNYRGAADIAEAVIAHGHRQIVICTDYHTVVEERRADRVKGFTETLEKYGIGKMQKRVFHEPVSDTPAAKFLLKRILKLFPETTVIMTDSDSLAYRLLQGLNELETVRPITVTGFGNLGARSGNQKIPSVEQHPEEIGVQSVNELFRMIEDPDYVSPARIEIETEPANLDKLPYLR